ncbi:hypothetical protein HKBW3S42_01629, partial [Candidatus Hakubella thermalkaliphila]
LIEVKGSRQSLAVSPSFLKWAMLISKMILSWPYSVSKLYQIGVEELFRDMNEELGFQKIMVRTLRSINKLLEIALLVYIFAFSLLKKMGPPLAMLLELGGKLGLKGKS